MNLNYLLNKAYYEPIQQSNFEKYNKILREMEFCPGSKEVYFSQDSFCMKILYPGLLIGIGNTHEAGAGLDEKNKNAVEIKMGFTLDYVTGLPVIPGSTVKGVLRSPFKRCHNNHEYLEYIREKFSGFSKGSCSNISDEEILGLEKSIFQEGVEKVIFYDAVPVQAGKDNHILGLDNITPHSAPLLNPIPLTMLKVIPGVVFLFRFGFERWDKKNMVTPDCLLHVFKEIITDLGIGAKTNVGFGAMEPIEPKDLGELKNLETLCYHYLEPQLSNYESTNSQQPSQRVSRPAIKPEGICQWAGCNEKTKEKRNGEGFQEYCQPHFLESQKKKKNGVKNERITI
jgi:CRISPR-associated protein Cmr6